MLACWIVVAVFLGSCDRFPEAKLAKHVKRGEGGPEVPRRGRCEENLGGAEVEPQNSSPRTSFLTWIDTCH